MPVEASFVIPKVVSNSLQYHGGLSQDMSQELNKGQLVGQEQRCFPQDKSWKTVFTGRGRDLC